MSDETWTEAELDAWFRDEILAGSSFPDWPMRAVTERFGMWREADREISEVQPSLEQSEDPDFMHFWGAIGRLSFTGEGFELLDRSGAAQWDDLSVDAKAAGRRAWENHQHRLATAADDPLPPPESVVDELGSTVTGGYRLTLPIVIGGAVLLLAVIVGSGAFRDDGTIAVPDDGASTETQDVDEDEPTSTLPPPRPETDEPVTVSFTGDDPCGVAAGLVELGINIAPRPGPQGAEIAFFGPNGPNPFALTGTLFPTVDGPVWEDRGDADSQAFTDVTVADGAISGVLEWLTEDGCASTVQLRIDVPSPVTAWWELVPPNAPPAHAFDGSLTVTDGTATLTGTLTTPDGAPAEGVALVVELQAEDGTRTTLTTVSGPGGAVELSAPAPAGDVYSTSMQVIDGVTSLGYIFGSDG